MTTDVVDGQAVEVGTELVASHPPGGLFRTDDPVEVVERATRVANALKDVIDKKHLSVRVQSKEHITVEGWQLLGAMLGVTAVPTESEPVDGGWKARVEARTADGRVVGAADALCTKHEKRGPWSKADDYARLSMAQTRATSKALKGPLGFVVSLAGYASTPAEEMTFAESEEKPTEPAEVGPSLGFAKERTANFGSLEGKASGCISDKRVDQLWERLVATRQKVPVRAEDVQMKLSALGMAHKGANTERKFRTVFKSLSWDQAKELEAFLALMAKSETVK